MRPLLLLALLLPVLAWGNSSTFNGSTSRVTLPDVSALRATVFSLGCWTYRTGDGEGGSGRIMNSASGARFDNSDTTNYAFYAQGWTTPGIWTYARPTANAWHHVAVAYDATSDLNDPNIYVNAVLQTENQNQGPSGTYSHPAGDPYVIGDNAAGSGSWAGELASCFYYNRIVTANELRAIMRCGPPSVPNGLVGYWPLGDHGGRNYTSTTTLTGTPTSVSTNRIGPPLNAPQGGICE